MWILSQICQPDQSQIMIFNWSLILFNSDRENFNFTKIEKIGKNQTKTVWGSSKNPQKLNFSRENQFLWIFAFFMWQLTLPGNTFLFFLFKVTRPAVLTFSKKVKLANKMFRIGKIQFNQTSSIFRTLN